METLTDAERKVAFHTQPIWKRAATVVAGPLFNFLLTIAVFAVLFSIYGSRVWSRWWPRSPPDSPAAKAGILPGDRFVSVDGSKVETFADVQRLVSGRAGDAIIFIMLRDGKEITLTATPHLMEQQDALGNKVKVAVIGVVNNEELGQPRLHHLQPCRRGGAAVERDRAHHSAHRPVHEALRGRPRGQMPARRPGQDRQHGGQAATLGFQWLVQLVALLSVGIGILNLLPIPPLDGGHLLFYGIEAVFRRPVSERVMEMVYRAGFTVVLRSWDSCSGTTCLGVEIVKKFGVRGTGLRLRLPCRGIGVTRKPRLWLSKHKLTRSLAYRENPVITDMGFFRDVRFSRRGDYEKKR